MGENTCKATKKARRCVLPLGHKGPHHSEGWPISGLGWDTSRGRKARAKVEPESDKHTPGPWKWEKHGDGWALYSGRGPMTHGLNLLTVSQGPFDWNWEHNMRLIAAAPDLLDACRAVLAVRENQSPVPARVKAATAIRRATEEGA
jgi:hypothetical protein